MLIKTASSLSLLLILVLLVLPASSINMADSSSAPLNPASSAPESTAVHIVYTEQPKQNEEPETFHIRILTSVLGSEEAAKDALVYSYKTAASGFSAKLTPQQVTQISQQPGVLQVIPSRTLQLHSGPGMGKLH